MSSSAPYFEKTAIIGPGLLGASLGLAMKEAGLTGHITGIGRRESSLRIAQDKGAIDSATLLPEEGVQEADLVVLATGIETALKIGRRILPHLKAGCLLTDVASAKQYLHDGLAPLVPPTITYISSHPMAGSEQKGPAASHKDLYKNALCILTPPDSVQPSEMDRLHRFWQALGMRTCELEPATHDRFLAAASHLPHIAATALIEVVCEDAMQYSATGFQDATRLASGDPEIWRDIAMCNRVELAGVLQELASKILSFAQALERSDDEAVFARLASSKEKRDQFYGHPNG